MSQYLVVAGFDHEQCGFVVFDADKERGERAAMFLGGVEQHWLVHRDAHRQPRPQSKQLSSQPQITKHFIS